MSRRILTLGSVFLAAVVIAILVSVTAQDTPENEKSTPGKGNIFIKLLRDADISGFPKVLSPRAFSFPADHGPHPEHRLEWWYYTGNLETETGRHFGYQLTFFRMSLSPQPVKRVSKWGTQAYLSHFALTDVENQRFYAFERKSRGAVGLAGAQAHPFGVWVENCFALDGSELPKIRPGVELAEGERMYLSATEDEVAIDLMLARGKAPVPVGDKGMSRKSEEAGNASYYYSLTRMPTTGTIRIAGKTFQVRGTSWLDREWGSSLLGKDQAGWDWFALQLDDEREVMFYLLRQCDGGASPFSRGVFVRADGSSCPLTLEDIQIDVLNHWQSPISGTRYPARWRLHIPAEGLTLAIEPYLGDQELNLSMGWYWEGAVRVSGTNNGQPISGSGYVELTGFGKSH